MNRTQRSIASITLFASLAIIVSVHGQSSNAQERTAQQRGSCCGEVTGSSQGQATGPATFVTAVNLVVRGGRLGGVFGMRSMAATSTASIVQQGAPDGGVIPVISCHVFELQGSGDGDGQCEPGEDCFTTLDRASLSATDAPGKFRLNSSLGIINGRGVFEHICGRLEVARGGLIDFTATPPTVRWEVEGHLCECR